jgi:DNA polymerase (family 10)
MSTNEAVAERLSLIAQLLELTGADKFRVLANQKAARVLEAYPSDVGPIARGGGAEGRKRLLDIDGVGPKIADKIVEFVETGKIEELEALRAEVPAGLVELLAVPGLGPKTVRAMWQELGITDVAGLEGAIADGRLLTLPRMGEKAVEKIRSSLALRAESGKRLPLGVALPVAERVVALMLKVPGVKRAAYAGSLRRGRETVGDIDVLVVADDPGAAGAAAEALCTQPGVRQVLAHGESKCSVRLAVRDEAESTLPASERLQGNGGGGDVAATPTVQVDLRVVPNASWGAALMYFTGSKEHNVKLRERAQRMGLTLNEYGLFPEDQRSDEPPQKRGVKAVAGATEEDVFAALGLCFMPPEMREDRGETELKATPRLVEVADIRAELHSHTTASDGSLSIAELAERARKRGFHTLAVTDHSQSSAIANGLKPDRLRAHMAAVREAGRGIKGLRLLAGSEVDILADGRLDYDDELLAELDVVVASPHSALSQEPAAATARLLKAVKHPLVHILGHPTGRLILRRTGLQPDMPAIIAAAKAHSVALEINAHWLRLDLRDTHVHAAVEAGCLIAINCDVHHPDDFDNLRYGVLTGRRGWLTPEQCVNCWDADRLHEWLASKRGGRAAAGGKRGER